MTNSNSVDTTEGATRCFAPHTENSPTLPVESTQVQNIITAEGDDTDVCILHQSVSLILLSSPLICSDSLILHRIFNHAQLSSEITAKRSSLSSQEQKTSVVQPASRVCLMFVTYNAHQVVQIIDSFTVDATFFKCAEEQ